MINSNSILLPAKGSASDLYFTVKNERSKYRDLKTPKYEWIKKMWYIYKGILLSHKKNEISLQQRDRLRHYHTKWSKPDKERQISCDTACMWNLKNDGNKHIYQIGGGGGTGNLTDMENKRIGFQRRWGEKVRSLGLRTSRVAQTVKHLPTMQETQVRSLG